MRFRGKYAFLSNFFECEIEYDGYKFPTSEHAYQYAKAKHKEDKLEILKAPTPGKAKRLGANVETIEGWNDKKVSIMSEILQIKFSKPEMLEKMLKVDEPIVEDNDWNDTFWGRCDGIGKNILGKLLENIKNQRTHLEY
jgi:ribA/ribD-fused uncharacterized protein